MKILITGDYLPSYNRTHIILTGLKALNIDVEEYPIKKRISSAQKKELSVKAEKADLIYCPPFTHHSVKTIKKITDKPLVFDPLISKYMTKVFDYKKVSRFSPRAIKNFYKDKIPLRTSDLIIADTSQHKEYFIRKFKVPAEKIYVLPIGVVRDEFLPKPKTRSNTFKVGFYGGFIPLQGVGKIILTAEVLKAHADIEFHLVGSGFEYSMIQKMVANLNLKNIIFPGYIDYNNLADHINDFDLCMGIFGETMKADIVIPNKVYHYAAMGKCVLTKDTPAIKELFSDGENIMLCNNDPQAMAQKIIELKKDDFKRNKIGENAHHLISGKYNEVEIAKMFIDIVKTVL